MIPIEMVKDFQKAIKMEFDSKSLKRLGLGLQKSGSNKFSMVDIFFNDESRAIFSFNTTDPNHDMIAAFRPR